MTVTDLVHRYFALASSPEGEDWAALFADDALVEDEGREHRGIDAIRAWRAGVPLVRHDLTAAESTATGTLVTCTITGDFPGSPFAGLTFHFVLDGDRIRELRIR